MRVVNTIIQKKVLNDTTGELENTNFVQEKKYKKIKGGFTMIYKAEYDNALENIVKSNLDLKLVNAIKDKFTYKQTDVFISTKSLSFRFGTSQRKVQKVIKSMCEAKLLYKNGETYRLNPFMFIPYHANGEELQNEWKELMLNRGDNK